jgi:reelin
VIDTAPSQFREAFEAPLSSSNWLVASGGSPASSLCGTLAAGQSMFFNGVGVRRVVTSDINTTNADILSFYLQIGYSSSILGSSVNCYSPSTAGTSATLSYSVDGGLTYTLLASYTYNSFLGPTPLTYSLPSGAKSSGTRFQWWQPASTNNFDFWVWIVCCGCVQLLGR